MRSEISREMRTYHELDTIVSAFLRISSACPGALKIQKIHHRGYSAFIDWGSGLLAAASLRVKRGVIIHHHHIYIGIIIIHILLIITH